MLSYRHSFHAGNDADVIKHIALITLLEALARKSTPYFVLDTHGGDGLYRLGAVVSGAGPEWHDGVARLWPLPHGQQIDPGERNTRGALKEADDAKDVPAAVSRWAELVSRENHDGKLVNYPGSPQLIARSLRPGDRAVVAELHPKDAPTLTDLLARARRISVREEDGYKTLRSAVPPPERRGLVVIDPAYERDDEGDRVYIAVREGLKRFGHGMFLVWYPLGGKLDSDRLVERLGQLPARKSFDLRYQRSSAHVRLREGRGLAGCGLFVVNPTWQLDEELMTGVSWTARRLDAESQVTLRWLVEDRGQSPSTQT